jgi:hypothetical protein
LRLKLTPFKLHWSWFGHITTLPALDTPKLQHCPFDPNSVRWLGLAGVPRSPSSKTPQYSDGTYRPSFHTRLAGYSSYVGGFY